MRQDARSLLERLGQNDFKYQEFDDPFADMELWPIFEALLRDQNIVGQQSTVVRMAEVQFRAPKAPEKAPEPSNFFARYGDFKSAPPTGTEKSGVNLRQFLGGFSEGEGC